MIYDSGLEKWYEYRLKLMYIKLYVYISFSTKNDY